MRKLLKYMKGYGKECVAGPLFKLFEAVLELFVPLIVAAIIDLGIGGEDSGYIVRMSLLLVALGALGFAFSATAQFFAARAAVGFASRLREALIAHVGKMSYSDLDRAGTSSLVTLVTNDVNQVQSGVNLTLRLLLRSPFIVFGAMIMAFFIDVPSAMIFVVIIPVLSIVVMGIMLACVPIYRRAQSKLEAVLGKTRENLTGARVIRAFCREEVEIADFDAKNSSLTAVQKLAGRISALMNPITFVLVNAAAIILIRTDAIRVESGVLTQGEVVALYNYMTQILVELIKMASLVISLAKSIAGANRIAAELDVPIGEGVPGRFKPTEDIFSEGKNADPAAYAVEFRAASLRYPGASAASLTGVTIAVGRGETVGIIGGTGSGKTTLVNMIGRFYDATGGEVLVGGVNVRDYHPADLRERIGIVPQRAALLSGSLRENLRLGKKDAQDEEIMTAARAACAAEVIEGKGGLDYIIEEEGRNLSGGQRQRLTIARALVKKPEILILDDSSSALDYATDAALRRSLAALPWRPAVFIVSQRASSVRHADKIIVLDDGVVAGIGTDGELLESCRVYREICESQNEGGTPGDEE